VEQPGLSATGDENGENKHLSLSGVMNSTGEIATFEFITLDGVTYVLGLKGIPGVHPDQWYKLPKEFGNVTRNAPSVKALLADMQIEDFRRGKFQSAGAESVSGLECTVWWAKNPKLAQGFVGIANSREAVNQLKALDSAEFKVVTCNDGYMHRITGHLEGHDPANPNNKASVKLSFLIFDHEAPVIITAPRNARDLHVATPGPTPTP
jgi:hypothetical protein